MIKQKLKRQKWFQLLFKKPLRWRRRWIDRTIQKHNSIYRQVVLGGTIVVRPRNLRSQFRIPARSDLARTVIIQGDYEPELCEAIRAVWTRSGAVVNIGANVGFWSIGIFDIVEGVEKVFAIEPNPEAFALLVENIALNKKEDLVIPIQACVAEAEGVVEFETIAGKPEYSSMGGIVHSAVKGLERKVIAIKAKTLDQIVQLPPDTVRLIIVDTEGADYLVLSGAREFLQKHKPLIIFECCDSLLKKFGHSVGMIRSMLEELGYEARRVARLDEIIPDELEDESAIAFPKSDIPIFFRK